MLSDDLLEDARELAVTAFGHLQGDRQFGNERQASNRLLKVPATHYYCG